MRKVFFIITFLFQALFCNAQNSLTAIVKDAATQELLSNVSASLGNTGKGTVSDLNGKIFIKNIPDGNQSITFSIVGYKEQTLSFVFPLKQDTTVVILMEPAGDAMDEVIVSSSRTNSRIENLPTKVEVIGQEEMEEENGIKPGSIASILGDIAGIQFQQTSAVTGNADMRIQGLPGKYTQILRDGLPLFGGYSGSFGILQIPPLDLKQVELIKGASSTLYGGGAIAGLINLISKKPKEGQFERSITLNQSTLKESNVNAFLSNRKGKTGYTLFAGLNYQYAVDVNKDRFSDVPDLKSYFIHPRLFMYPNKQNEITIGLTSNYEDRNGGDIQVLHGGTGVPSEFFIRNKSFRNTADAEWRSTINTTSTFIVKGTASLFNRRIESNTFGMKANQLSYFTEASYQKKLPAHDIVAGLNFTGERFKKGAPNNTTIDNYNFATTGVFIQDDWKLHPKIIIQPGIRWDYHNRYGSFLLPRLSILYKISTAFTTRLGGGMGYKIPTVFSSDVDERNYPLLRPLTGVKAEQSIGANWDVNFHQPVGNWELTINQGFFITQINDPIIITQTSSDITFSNASRPLLTRGLESFVSAHYDKLELYFGYVYTYAQKKYDAVQPYLSLSARNKFATVIAYEFSGHFRAGIEAATTGKQYLDDGSTTPSYLFAAGMMRYDIGICSLVLNCENLFDYRQTRKEPIVLPPLSNPQFRQLWAPIDGRVINLSARFKW